MKKAASTETELSQQKDAKAIRLVLFIANLKEREPKCAARYSNPSITACDSPPT